MSRVGNLIHEGLEPIGFREGDCIALRTEAQPITMLAIYYGKDTAQPLCPSGNLKVYVFL